MFAKLDEETTISTKLLLITGGWKLFARNRLMMTGHDGRFASITMNRCTNIRLRSCDMCIVYTKHTRQCTTEINSILANLNTTTKSTKHCIEHNTYSAANAEHHRKSAVHFGWPRFVQSKRTFVFIFSIRSDSPCIYCFDFGWRTECVNVNAAHKHFFKFN